MARKVRVQQKSPMKKYTLKDFRLDFPHDEACLEWLKNRRWPDGIFCEKCQAVTAHYLVASRKSYSCQNCGNHVHPTANTIFHKSSTPLTLWFYAIYLMAQTRGGISAKQVERELGVTYKTAWRMFKLIRSCLDENKDVFGGSDECGNPKHVEMDEAYFGEKPRKDEDVPRKRGRGTKKTPVFGMVERKGRVKAIVVPDTQGKTLVPIIEEFVERDSKVHTDEYHAYDKLESKGFNHFRILHNQEIYVMGDIHTQTIEGFWALVKTGIIGVYHGCGKKYLQSYVNEYAFRYNHRMDVTPMFMTFLDRVAVEVEKY
jgi:transposase